jgi:uncharacterized membrane protein
MGGNLLVVLIEAVNLWLRCGEPTAALPSPGVFLSGAAFLLLGFTGWKGGEMVFRRGVGVSAGNGPD